MKHVFLALLILGTACSTPTGPMSSSKKQTASVRRAVFTTGVENREPRDKLREFRNDRQRIYFFTELHGMTGQKVFHRWKYRGKVMANVPFKVKGPRWRVYSSKWLQRDWLGDWTVSVVDRRGRTLSAKKFSYTQARGIWRPKESAPASADSEEGYLDKATRSARDFYDQVFGDE